MEATVSQTAESQPEPQALKIMAGMATRFTPANAREMAARANAKRKEREEERERERQESPIAREEERREMVAEQIARTRKELNRDLLPRDRAQLLQALDKLLDRERILTGKPLPGSHRPTRNPKPTSSGTLPTPTE